MNKTQLLLTELMSAHIDEANAIFELAKDYDMIGSQEFMDWQDELNFISVQ